MAHPEDQSPTSPTPAVSMAKEQQIRQQLTQELIRQNLLAKQKHLLGIRQKIVLELEQTKAQMAGNFVFNPPTPPPPSQTPPSPAAPLPVTRDSRLNGNSGSGSRSKDQVSAPSSSSPGVRPKEHKDPHHAPLALAPRPAPPRFNKDHQAGPPTRPPGKRGSDIVAPPTKERSNEPSLKKDPRLVQRKRLHEKTGEDDSKEKKRSRSILKVRGSSPPVVPHNPLPPRPRPPAHKHDNGPSHTPHEPLPHHHHGPMRGFDGPPHPSVGQQQPRRFDEPMRRFDGPHGGPQAFQQHRPPMQRFDGPAHMPGLRFDMSNHQQQPFHQPMVMHIEQRPPRYPSGTGPLSSMPGLQYQPGPLVPFPGPTGPGFYNPGHPQQVNMVPNVTQAFLPQNTVAFTQTVAPPVAPVSHFGQMDVNELLTKLISTGIIPAATPPTHTAGSTEPSLSAPVEEELDDNIPDLTSFNKDDLKQRYESIIDELHTGKQCPSCGLRFTASQTDVYADHLDWHYRHNRSEKKVTHRSWYCSLTEWIGFDEVSDLEERSKSPIFEKVKKTQETSKQKDIISSVKAATNVVDESCENCAEPFEMCWEEEEEEWHLKNAIRVDDKPYHPSCYEDYKNTCSFGEAIPDPNTGSNQHPLSAFKQKDTPSSSCRG